MQSSRPWRPTASAPSPRGRCTPSFCGWKRGAHPGRFRDSALGPRRKYYALTEQGREELAQFHASFQAMAAAVARLPGFAPEKEETP